MTSPIPGDIPPAKPLQQPAQSVEQTTGKPFKEVQQEQTETQTWFGGYFTPKQLVQFKENLIKFLSAQVKAEQQQMQKANEQLKKVAEGEE